ncbi:MAG: hypothetical protein H6550_16120 [Chitinophagales bacterium]|nr:hypothetical protein [Chitinophagales bacterium]
MKDFRKLATTRLIVTQAFRLAVIAVIVMLGVLDYTGNVTLSDTADYVLSGILVYQIYKFDQLILMVTLRAAWMEDMLEVFEGMANEIKDQPKQ